MAIGERNLKRWAPLVVGLSVLCMLAIHGVRRSGQTDPPDEPERLRVGGGSVVDNPGGPSSPATIAHVDGPSERIGIDAPANLSPSDWDHVFSQLESAERNHPSAYHGYGSIIDMLERYRDRRLVTLAYPDAAFARYARLARQLDGLDSETVYEILFGLVWLSERQDPRVRAVLYDLIDRRDAWNMATEGLKNYPIEGPDAFFAGLTGSNGRKLHLAELVFEFPSIREFVSQLAADPETRERFGINWTTVAVAEERLVFLASTFGKEPETGLLLDTESAGSALLQRHSLDYPEYFRILATRRRVDAIPLLRARASTLFRGEFGISPEAFSEATGPVPDGSDLRYRGETYEEVRESFRRGKIKTPYTYDEAIWTIGRLGGDPTEAEKARLNYFGLWGDPRPHADAILKTLR